EDLAFTFKRPRDRSLEVVGIIAEFRVWYQNIDPLSNENGPIVLVFVQLLELPRTNGVDFAFDLQGRRSPAKHRLALHWNRNADVFLTHRSVSLHAGDAFII